MNQPTPEQRARTLRRIEAAIALLSRDITPEERRQAAEQLGLERYLPEPQQSLELS